MPAWRPAPALLAALLAAAGCQFFQAPTAGGPQAQGTGESVEGRVRLGHTDQDGLAGPRHATLPLGHTRPLALGDDFGGIPAAAGIVANASPALSQSSGLTLLEPYRAGFRIAQAETALFVEVVNLVSGDLLARTLADPAGRFKVALPRNARYLPLALQATTLQGEAITLYLAALLPPAPAGPKARTQDISPGTTSAALAVAKLGGVTQEFDVATGFRGFRAGGVAALGLMAEGADEVAAPFIDRGIGQQLTLLEPYRIAAGNDTSAAVQAAFYRASVLGVRLAGAVHRRMRDLESGKYRIAGISLGESSAALKLAHSHLGAPPEAALKLAGFTVSSVADIGAWTGEAAGKVDESALAAEASRKEALARERAEAARQGGADRTLLADLDAALGALASGDSEPTPIPVVDLGSGFGQMGLRADGRLVVATQAGGRLLEIALATGSTARGNLLLDGLQSPDGVAVASEGTVYFSEAGANRVRKLAGAVVQTVAEGLNGPGSLALTASGTLYVAETATGRILAIGTDGKAKPYAGGGAQEFSDSNLAAEGLDATGVKLPAVGHLAVSPSQELYFSNGQKFGVVWRVDVTGKIRTFAGRHANEGATGDDIDAAGPA
ncbi:MAG: hypothetical protein FJZ01_12875 [Candidatus Sericytochromatia bacterium]|nr:hypothetical protein [Candidatus Tanganyikabacteria bacterium]